MTNLSEAVDLTEITAGLPRRIHQVADKYVVDSPDRVALIMSFYVSGTALGGFMGRVGTGILTDWLNWRVALTSTRRR